MRNRPIGKFYGVGWVDGTAGDTACFRERFPRSACEGIGWSSIELKNAVTIAPVAVEAAHVHALALALDELSMSETFVTLNGTVYVQSLPARIVVERGFGGVTAITRLGVSESV